ncbi:hypothetical protein C8R43DRAFT_1235542 [Mycena crocata]|nr:hypothetical protein C8R43DRAFT_1235542 [Mycena crocata]
MTPFRVRKVEPPAAFRVSETPELNEIVEVLTRAFSTDALTAIVTGHRPHSRDVNPLVRRLSTSTAVAGLVGGDVYVAETTDSPTKIVGCAVWYRPGRTLYDSEEQVQLALQPLLASFSENLRRWWDDFLPKYTNCVTLALGEGVDLNSWRLQTLAVDPDYQRQHVGTLLVNAVMKEAVVTKTPLCVDCSEENNLLAHMFAAFRVRKLDPSTAIDKADPASLPEIGDVEKMLTRAFTGDLFAAVVTAHDPKDPDTGYVAPFCMSTVVAGLLGGEVYVAETVDTNKVIGCAVWFGPGHTMYDTEDQLKYSLGPLMASFDQELQNWWHSTFLPAYNSFLTSVLGEGTKHNSWHLQTLAVDPKYQRKGAATLLVNAVAEKAILTKTPLCVECSTETNIEVYIKLGFQLMSKDNAGPDASKLVYTGVKGEKVPMWVLVRR